VLPPKPQMKLQQKWSCVSGSGQLVRNAHTPGGQSKPVHFKPACIARWGICKSLGFPITQRNGVRMGLPHTAIPAVLP
jgi:hypothetical protein